ncbi:uncharacterized protein TNCV_3339281 [Trichonephila clavipes]|nr:uncharacterized protein TNCV_3339281 [Trichonephila clavipes]
MPVASKHSRRNHINHAKAYNFDIKLAAKSERRWQVIAPDALPPTRVNLECSTEDVPETSKTDIQLETENHVSPPAGCEVTASTNADLTTIDPVEMSVKRMDVKSWVNKLTDPLLPTLLMDTESTTKNVPKTSTTDLTELQALFNDKWVECEPIQEETENHISPSTEYEVPAPTMTDLTAVDPFGISIVQMAQEAQKSGLADDIVTGQLLGTETYSVNNNINTDEEDQDLFHNSDDDEVDPDYNTSNSGFESDSESKDEPATGIEIKNVNEPITRKRKRGKFNKRTLAKKMRNCGEEYESKTRGRVNKRSMKPPCHNCKLKCTEKIDENYRKAIFAMFWGMGDLQRQREFIKDSTQAVVPKYQRITLNRKRERGSNQLYSITKDGEKIRLSHEDFFDIKALKDSQVILPILDIRMFKVIKDDDNFYFKTSYGSHAWEEAKKRNKRGNASMNPVLAQAYSKRLTNDEKKKKGILNLVTNGTIPSIYSDFYKNL